jgi:hypothetical protein
MATQLAKQLLKVRQRNLLPLADGSQCHGATILAQGQINHCRNGKPTFGCETHCMLLDDLLTTLQEPLLGWTPTLRQTQKNCS